MEFRERKGFAVASMSACHLRASAIQPERLHGCAKGKPSRSSSAIFASISSWRCSNHFRSISEASIRMISVFGVRNGWFGDLAKVVGVGKAKPIAFSPPMLPPFVSNLSHALTHSSSNNTLRSFFCIFMASLSGHLQGDCVDSACTGLGSGAYRPAHLIILLRCRATLQPDVH